jgi:flavin-dependent dehydrogenase
MGRRSRRGAVGRGAEAECTAVVIGASMAGLFAAAALATHGWTVQVLERDDLSIDPEHRRGIPQDRQAHILLHRGMVSIDQLVPGFRAELLARDAVPFDTGSMPWLGEYGWLDTGVPGWEVVSATRPLMDAVARDLVQALPGVSLVPRTRVTALRAAPQGWLVSTGPAEQGDAPDLILSARLVVDASGRSSRLDRWLPELADSDVEEVDARVGYAGRLYQQSGSLPLRTGVMVFGRAEDGASGLALPVEEGRWMISASGLGDRRPPREPAGFETFLASLRDPAIIDLVDCLEPVSEVAVHRQTANRRHGWGRHRGWPPGLLVVGDALCSFNPIYGQGITVAALQAEALGRWLSADRRIDHRLQHQLRAITDLPWSIATSSDRRFTGAAPPSRAQRLSSGFTTRMGRLAAAGNARATRALSDVYHLMASPAAFLHPALLLAASRPLPATPLPRPAVLDELTRVRREQPPAARADA